MPNKEGESACEQLGELPIPSVPREAEAALGRERRVVAAESAVGEQAAAGLLRVRMGPGEEKIHQQETGNGCKVGVGGGDWLWVSK